MEKKKEENIDEVKDKELNKEEKEKINDIVEEAKQKGNMTYGDLATKLNNVNPENIDAVFDEFEKGGIDLLPDDFDEEPDIEDLKEKQHQKNAEMKELDKKFTELKNEYKGISLELAQYKKFVKDYINPDIADVLLQQEGIIKNKFGSSVSDDSVKRHMITADTLLPDDDSMETVDPDEIMMDEAPSESNIIDFMRNKLQ